MPSPATGSGFLIIGFLLWLAFRFVKAHEKMADGIYDIKLHLKNLKNNDSSIK